MTPRLRKLVLTFHVAPSVASLGAVVAYLALGLGGLYTGDVPSARTAFLSMEMIGWFVIAPLIFVALLTGLVQSLVSDWGLFRYYWVAVKFVLTVATLLVLVRTLDHASDALPLIVAVIDIAQLRNHLMVHAGGGLVVLIALTVLSLYKPWGLTPFYRRTRAARRTP